MNDTPKAPLSFLPGPELKDPLGSTNLFTESVWELSLRALLKRHNQNVLMRIIFFFDCFSNVKLVIIL